jgi:hypothetical protein
MALGSRPHFRLHSERAEQDGLCAGLLYGVQKGVPAVGMIAIYDYGTGFFTEDGILDGLCPSEKPWLQASELNQHTQQRRDDFVARENQHRTQHDQPRGDEAIGQLMDPDGLSGVSGPLLRYSGTDVHPLRHQSEGW